MPAIRLLHFQLMQFTIKLQKRQYSYFETRHFSTLLATFEPDLVPTCNHCQTGVAHFAQLWARNIAKVVYTETRTCSELTCFSNSSGGRGETIFENKGVHITRHGQNKPTRVRTSCSDILRVQSWSVSADQAYSRLSSLSSLHQYVIFLDSVHDFCDSSYLWSDSVVCSLSVNLKNANEAFQLNRQRHKIEAYMT